ncbi:MAG: peptidase S16 [Alphaproteobacteria bacterium]|nr:peptidase S16 [Alphaproteobacteria bacterium]
MVAKFPGLRFDELPRTIPVFPLTGALLLPRARLPLNVFEPRYLDMVREARAGSGVIGMIQPRKPGADMDAMPALYGVGCLGQITEHEPSKDGRVQIALAGVCRFEVVDELPADRAYRRVVASYGRYRGDLDPPNMGVDRKRLMRSLEAFVGYRGIKIDWTAAGKAPDEALVSALAMLLPFQPAERQAMLEAPTLAERVDTLALLLEMALAAPSGVEPTRQ